MTALVTVGDTQLWTTTGGHGPPLVLCHGGPGLWDDLGPVAEMVEDLVTVHRYDQRGSGRSDRIPPYDVSTLLSDLDALREHWAHRRWVVGGHSWGASLALAYAVTHPHRTAALLYVSGTGVGWRWHQEYRREQQARLTPQQRSELAELRRRRAELSPADPTYRDLDRRICLLEWSTDFADRNRALELAASLLDDELAPDYDVNRTVTADWKRWIERTGVERRLRQSSCPTLVVHGLGDPRPGWVAEELAAAIPGSRLELLEGVGHLPWLEHPDRLREVLRSFLEDRKDSLGSG